MARKLDFLVLLSVFFIAFVLLVFFFSDVGEDQTINQSLASRFYGSVKRILSYGLPRKTFLATRQSPPSIVPLEGCCQDKCCETHSEDYCCNKYNVMSPNEGCCQDNCCETHSEDYCCEIYNAISPIQECCQDNCCDTHSEDYCCKKYNVTSSKDSYSHS
ncbi:hypothetical protein SUGI_1130240 [Cryptomeria japonica]|nr:hypothetical protein SUGI_1130240 [Cryptomeria japonica]